MRLLLGLLFTCGLPCLAGQDWTQDAGNAQRTGATPEEPGWPWTYAWSWNGADEQGGAGGHHYHQPRPHEPWEARIVTGAGLIFAPAGAQGLYALRAQDGSVAWHFAGGTCAATPAFDAAGGALFVGTQEGSLQKLDAATGASLAHRDTGGALTKALLLAGSRVYVLAADGTLRQFDSATLRETWAYPAGAPASTVPAYSASRDAVLFCTEDLFVHCVAARDGVRRWRVKPTPLDPAGGASFTGGWPVVADQSGVVFVRLGLGSVDRTLWSGGGAKGKWPAASAEIRRRLVEHPELKNLFALQLDDGAEAFVPAVGPAGVEDLRAGRPWLRPHAFPVVRVVDGHEVAYLPWRSGDTRDPQWDARWDSHLGEMVLDAATVPGLVAGDLRFVQFEEHGGWLRITDEACPLSLAGETLFSAHWDVSQAARLTDRSPGLGLTRAAPIRTAPRPPVARHLRLPPDRVDPATHWAACGLSLMDGRSLPGPGWWAYANVLDPPTPAREAYSEGILPRYTCVAQGLIIVQGNGGDLLVLRCSKAPAATP